MIDLETLGTSANAIVLSVGAVIFDPMRPFDDHHEPVDSEFYAALDTTFQQRTGRTINDGTLRWWMRQGKQARLAIAGENVEPENPESVLKELKAFIPDNVKGVWGNGSDFDNAILQHMADQYGVKDLWPFWANRCFRTFTNLHDPKKRLRPVANNHHAVMDCINQIHWMQNIIAELGVEV
jgi:hypothetical protein